MFATATRGFGRRLQRLFAGLQLAVALAAVPSLAAVYYLMRWLHTDGGAYVAPLLLPVSGWVFFWGAAGYVLLAGGVLNCLLLFATNQPWPAVHAMALATLANLVTGFLASRFWYRCFAPAGCGSAGEAALRYPQAVVGFVVGALVLWWLGNRATRRALAQADYLLYLNT